MSNHNPNNPDIGFLTLFFFLATLALTVMYMVAEADNQYLEQRYHQCSGQYV